METCMYTNVETKTPKHEDLDNGIPRKYLLRQIFVCSGIWVSYFTCGLCYGSPTVFIPQIRREANSSDAVSVEMASWLSSTLNFSGFVNAFILSLLAKVFGRKLSFIYICGSSLIGHIILYFSTTTTQILISEMIQGGILAAPVTVSIMVLTEYVSPRYRSVFLTLKSAIFLWGIWVANAMGTFVHWKNIGILSFICSIYSLLTSLFWPESPYWLASKNKFKECKTSHRWLKGYSSESELELQTLIESRKIIKSETVMNYNFAEKTLKLLKSKSFYKPISLSLTVISLYHFSGKIACGMYAIDIIKRITGNESTAYMGMLVLDGITVFGMYIGCGLSTFLKRRTLLLVSSTLGVTFLYCLSLYLYLVHLELMLENTITSMSLLIGYSLTISVGPMIMATTILCELTPVKYRNSSVLIIGCFANVLMGSVLKISPFILNYFGARGLFLFFAVTASAITFLNYKVLPETKDKNILEIQESLLGTEKNKKSVEAVDDKI